jgi:tetratricopeptide (TPR) repeat protein
LHAALVAILLARAGLAQSPAANQEALPDEADAAVEQLLGDLKLDSVLASQLRERIAHAKIEDRVRPAEQLARLYVRMLGATTDPAERRRLEQLGRDLLERVPDSDSSELRLDMAKATYLKAEEVSERWRLRLASPEERSEALRVLNDVLPAFTQVRARIARRVEALEQREKAAAGGPEEGVVRAELADSRRVRAIAAYYEGWTRYYLAYLGNDRTQAKEALEAFGVLLNAVPGRAPSVERFPTGNLRLDHVARAVFGAAMSNSLMGNEVDAMRWLDVMAASEDISTAVQGQIFSRQFLVLTHAGRWSDVESLVRRRRLSGVDATLVPLTPQESRLVAIQSLDALRSGQLREGLKTSVGMVSRAALGDLVSQGELAQIVDLVKQYGTLPLGDDGFIVAYVRALQTFDDASGTQTGEGPATDPATINAFREAAKLFDAAIRADDANQFELELARAHLRRGLALFRAGDLLPAADAFEKAFELGRDERVRQDALWYAVVALDSAVERGQAQHAARRDRLATLYVQQFPRSENATRLLIRQVNVAGVDDAKTVEILLAVGADSPLYLAARRHASRLLYQQYRGAMPSEKQFLGLRFADLAEELMRLEMPRAMGGTDDDSRQAAESVVLRTRQLLDVLLSASTPDLPRAEAAFATIDQLATRHGVSTAAFEAELLFRRLQMRIARGEQAEAAKIWDRLRGLKGPFADAADQWMYRIADDAWRREETNPARARELIRYGAAWLERLVEGDVRTAVRERVAQAGAMLWTSERDARMRDLAISLDQERATGGLSTIISLRRLATMLEERGEQAPALDAWTQLLSSMEPGSPEWYEPRFHTLRLLKLLDPAAANAAFTQFKLLYPNVGPEPYGPRIEQLGLQELRPAATPGDPEANPSSGGRKRGGP